MMGRNNEKAESIAKDVLKFSRNTLLVNLRFLDMSLSMLEAKTIEESTYMSDGKSFLYNPMHVLRRFKFKQEATVGDYLHVVLHCVYQHMFVSPQIDKPVWDLACDIAVENIIAELKIKCVDSDREKPQWPHVARLRTKMKQLTAEKIYHYLKFQSLTDRELEKIRHEFFVDDHSIWYMTESEKRQRYGIGQSHKALDSNEDGQADRQELLEEWRKISERMQVDLESFGKQQGDAPGSILQNLKEVNREKYDYTAFLKKFAVMSEEMKINDEEFDYVYYTYGLNLYENMPLIEPLEYKEVKRVKEFIIAIDTSGSVAGDLVQAFVQKTYNILKSSESFASKINLHIIQCDAGIQEHVKITNQEEFDIYLTQMKIKGFGGTDFRPVFELTDNMIKEHEFTNLKGLIYFTDGIGTFPGKKPQYQTAFIFVDDEMNDYNVPPWAIKLILKKEDIN